MIQVQNLLRFLIEGSGSVWIEKNILHTELKKRHLSTYYLNVCIQQEKIIERKMDGCCYYSLPYYDKKEKKAAREAIRILRTYEPWRSFTQQLLTQLIDEGEKNYNIKLHEQQREAVIGAVNHGLFVITGGPGTGKTAVLKVLTYVLSRLFFGCTIKFTAPTGKAARRITESTQWPAKTIQKELKINMAKTKPDMFENHILIVDEVSMLDLDLAASLFSAMKNGRKLILVGDIEQLPSVGPGAVLRDLLLSEVIPYTMLTKTFRQAEDSNLFANILKVKDDDPTLTEGNDFEIHEVSEDPVGQLLNLYLQEKEKYGIENIALLLPYRKAGTLCSNFMNNLIQEKVNPTFKKDYIETFLDDYKTKVRYTVGDPVIQLENRSECANGDVGFVKFVDVKNQKIKVSFFNIMVEYSVDELPKQLALAYAISISKSQGSEYKSCIIGITNEHKQMLMRNVIYTGITRAKERCVLLKENSALMKAIFTEGSYTRITFFAENLVEEAEKAA